eukprot:5603438-Prymnesium_polylepis.2
MAASAAALLRRPLAVRPTNGKRRPCYFRLFSAYPRMQNQRTLSIPSDAESVQMQIRSGFPCRPLAPASRCRFHLPFHHAYTRSHTPNTLAPPKLVLRSMANCELKRNLLFAGCRGEASPLRLR